eukprot:CAMPEP_0115051144 /NCGR_PEP_ID=MMETSP0227-20121206/2179_1 /TAXON_ID=89957 /ORGANISM="Polarella glacialis, Strain CCMP 1383" /LENGTH=134 /DNA_ID=CAMNT_0002435083 /DNA_START=95 /DNA_END=496 /DNA_ORIENTATION=+
MARTKKPAARKTISERLDKIRQKPYASVPVPGSSGARGGAEGEPKTRLRTGIRALEEIKHYQSSTSLLIGKVPFQRVVKEVCDEVSEVFLEGRVLRTAAAKGALDEDEGQATGFQGYRIQSQALLALQEAAEMF